MSEISFRPEKKTYLIKGSIQNYEWGEKGKDAFIPGLLGFEPVKEVPYAELWIGIHPKAPSSLVSGKDEVRLDEVIQKYPVEMLGNRDAGKFDGKLPFLLKVLSAAEALSIQAHPDKEKARHLHAKDPANYPDDNHKPEIAIALDSLEALAGFNSPEEIAAFINEFNEVRELAGNLDITVETALKAGKREQAAMFVKELYEHVMIASDKFPEKLNSVLASVKAGIQRKTSGNLTRIESLFLELEGKYGNDVGLLSLFLLKYIKLSAGEAVFLNAGIPHAYLKGNIIECMANSDNVVRAGLTPKFKDLNALLYILSPEVQNVGKISPEDNGDFSVYKTPASEFEVSRPDKNEIVIQEGEFSIIAVIKGTVTAETDADKSLYSMGNIFIIPACAGKCRLTFSPDSLAFRVSVPS